LNHRDLNYIGATVAPACRICSNPTALVGHKPGKIIDRAFEIYRCSACGFVFVGNPCTDFDKIYSEEYYAGRGPDPLALYVFELEHPDLTIRKYEWQGLVKLIRILLQMERGFRWLDYGCGNGGLVRYARQQLGIEVFGFEEGWIASKARDCGIQLLDRSQLEALDATFDVVTAIEVVEHVVDPLETLGRVRKLLRPGGLFFCTTGNAARHRKDLLRWPYIVPEIHTSFFEPGTLEQALKRTGFRPEYRGFVVGHTEIIKCRTLKNLGVRIRSPWQSLLPWSAIAPIIDAYVGFTDHPIGWAQ
jgi:2-polyprenyl-3-methyl-5-hydroxy-6-metoxy-1,4-benzoquinol methylase